MLLLHARTVYALKSRRPQIRLHSCVYFCWIDELVKLYAKVHANSGFYQIQVGFGNYKKAQELLNQVEIDFPTWYSKIEFESPTYRVRLGRFKTKLEAERKYLEVRKKYPDAMLLKPEEKESKS